MSAFFNGIGHIAKAAFNATPTGQRVQQMNIQKQQANMKEAQDETDFATHMQSIGAKPVLNGVVQRPVQLPDGTFTDVGLHAKADPQRTIKYKDSTGQQVAWELPSDEDQANYVAHRHAATLATQFALEAPTRAAAADEQARNAAHATEVNRDVNGVPIPPTLGELIPGITTAPDGSQRKVLPAELAPLVQGADALNTTQQTLATQKKTAGLQALSAVNDQPTYDAWKAKYPAAAEGAPDTFNKNIVASLQRQAVPIEKQPEYDISVMTREAMNMDPTQMHAKIDAIIPPTGSTANLNVRTKGLFDSAISRGDLKGAQAIVKDASDQIGKTETAVATAKATAPIKINIAGQEAGARSDAQMQHSGLSEDDIARMGTEYAITGEMPKLGQGGGGIRTRVEAARQQFARDSGLSPRDLAVARMAYKGDTKALTALTAQAANIDAFEGTARKNLDLFLDAASKIPDTGVPWLNAPLRSLDANIVGSENMAAVNAARQVANNEIAKVTSGGGLGGVLSDSARHEVDAYNPASATFKQTKAIVKLLTQDMDNRKAGLAETIDTIKNNVGKSAGQSGAPPAAPVVAKPLPTTLTQADIGQVYVSPKTGQKMKITAVNPANSTQFQSVPVP